MTTFEWVALSLAVAGLLYGLYWQKKFMIAMVYAKHILDDPMEYMKVYNDYQRKYYGGEKVMVIREPEDVVAATTNEQ